MRCWRSCVVLGCAVQGQGVGPARRMAATLITTASLHRSHTAMRGMSSCGGTPVERAHRGLALGGAGCVPDMGARP